MSSTDERIPAFKAVPELVALLALSFLWPYYQRAFYRVTLFHSLGDPSLAYFRPFSWWCFLRDALRSPCGEAHGSGDRPFFHAADLRRSLSGGHHVLVGHGRSGYCGTSADCIRCSGHYRVRPQHAGGLGCMGAAADAHRLCERPVQCCGGVGVGSAMVACLLSPSAVVSPLSTGIMPVFGVFVAGVGRLGCCSVGFLRRRAGRRQASIPP